MNIQEIIPFRDEIRRVLRGTNPHIIKEYFDGRKLSNQNQNFSWISINLERERVLEIWGAVPPTS